MDTCKSLFAKLMDSLPSITLIRIIEQHGSDRHMKSLARSDQVSHGQESLSTHSFFSVTAQ